MTILIQSNKGKTIQHPYNFRITQGERITVYGEANDTAYLPLHSLFRQSANFGISFQSGPHGNLVISFTCDPEDQVMLAQNDPIVEANIAWHVFANPLAANEIRSAEMLNFTVAKIHFNVQNRCTIIGVIGSLPSSFYSIVVPSKPKALISTTQALLHFDGADGAVATVDEYGNTVTFDGNAKLATAYYKFGSVSLLLDEAENSPACPDNSTYGRDWVYCVPKHVITYRQGCL